MEVHIIKIFNELSNSEIDTAIDEMIGKYPLIFFPDKH